MAAAPPPPPPYVAPPAPLTPAILDAALRVAAARATRYIHTTMALPAAAAPAAGPPRTKPRAWERPMRHTYWQRYEAAAARARTHQYRAHRTAPAPGATTLALVSPLVVAVEALEARARRARDLPWNWAWGGGGLPLAAEDEEVLTRGVGAALVGAERAWLLLYALLMSGRPLAPHPLLVVRMLEAATRVRRQGLAWAVGGATARDAATLDDATRGGGTLGAAPAAAVQPAPRWPTAAAALLGRWGAAAAGPLGGGGAPPPYPPGERLLLPVLVDAAGRVAAVRDAGGAPGAVAEPRLARGGHVTLVVWNEARTSKRWRRGAAATAAGGPRGTPAAPRQTLLALRDAPSAPVVPAKTRWGCAPPPPLNAVPGAPGHSRDWAANGYLWGYGEGRGLQLAPVGIAVPLAAAAAPPHDPRDAREAWIFQVM